jgi:hypothetical protein
MVAGLRVRKFDVMWSISPNPKRLVSRFGSSGRARRTRPGSMPGASSRCTKRSCVSPNAEMMSNQRWLPSGETCVQISVMGVAPRAISSRNARSMSSTASTIRPTPSGCCARKRALSACLASGSMNTKRTLPASTRLARARSVRSNSGPLTATSAKSSRSR